MKYEVQWSNWSCEHAQRRRHHFLLLLSSLLFSLSFCYRDSVFVIVLLVIFIVLLVTLIHHCRLALGSYWHSRPQQVERFLQSSQVPAAGSIWWSHCLEENCGRSRSGVDLVWLTNLNSGSGISVLYAVQKVWWIKCKLWMLIKSKRWTAANISLRHCSMVCRS